MWYLKIYISVEAVVLAGNYKIAAMASLSLSRISVCRGALISHHINSVRVSLGLSKVCGRRSFFNRLRSPRFVTTSAGNREAAADISKQENKNSVGLIDVNPPRGTRDFPPEDMRLRNWLFSNFREVWISSIFSHVIHFTFSPAPSRHQLTITNICITSYTYKNDTTNNNALSSPVRAAIVESMGKTIPVYHSNIEQEQHH